MKPIKGYWVVIGLFGVMLLLWAMRYYLASSPGFPGPRYFQLTHDSGRTLDPALSADGRLIAFASDKAGRGNLDIWVRQVGGESIQVTQAGGDEREPTFSPDGLKVAYTAADGIYTVDMRGSPPVLLVSGGSHPAYSPDGRWLAYTLGDSEVWVLPEYGGTALQVGRGGVPSWSEDGHHLLLAGDPWQIVSLDNRAVRAVQGHAGFVRWYRGFAYYATAELERVRLLPTGEIDGAPERLTTEAGSPRQPTVAGTRVVYLRNGALWLTNVGTSH